jgi:glutathione peroxidase
MFSKIEVNGEGACDLYRFLKSSQGDGADISWNFEKFLVDGQGQVIARFAPPTSPEDIARDLDQRL